ncbi:MAG: hypothetical protein LAO23_15390 [Acidobacteriia bacterium]|nr:hypothetical protein [Terriglobia bacterium]
MNPMRPYGAMAVRAAVCVAVVSSMAAGVWAQEGATPRHTGVPHDWSERHIVFSRDALAQHPELIYREPRILHQAMQRWQAPNSNVFSGADGLSAFAGTFSQRDWNLALGSHVIAHMYPAKFSFDPAAAPDCSNDYVVFGMLVPGIPGANGGQANLVALNNLYVNSSGTGFCSGIKAPTVFFAYNATTVTGGKILTSPVLSMDGTKIAFVESVAGTSPQAIFHVLTWTKGQGAIKNAVAPGASMTSLTFAPASCSASSPWVDYGADIAYVGSDKGTLYKIKGVFKGTPTLVTDNIWPVTVHANYNLSPPVLDAGRSALMVGSSDGSLYRIDTTTGGLTALVVGLRGGPTPGIVGAPIVDVANGTTFVVSANDGTSAVLVEADTSAMTQKSKARIGLGSAGGTKLNLYEPALSNDYFTDPSTGVIRLCGTNPADTNPWQYSFGFSGTTMNTTASFSQQLLSSTTARCTGWTEFFNATLGIDFFFFGLTQDCTAKGGSGGCVAETTGDTPMTTATVNGGPSGIVVDNYSNAAEAASIYLTTETGGTGYKFTQNGLQ